MGEYDFLKIEFDTEKRIEELDRAFQSFVYHEARKNSDIVLQLYPNAATDVVHFYCSTIHPFLKSFFSKKPKRLKINRFKIASLTQLAIVKLQPIEHDHDLEKRKLNARLAMYVAKSLIDSFPSDIYDDPTSGTRKEPGEIIFTVMSQHYQWLVHKDPNEFPAYLNGQVMFLMHLCYAYNWTLEMPNQKLK